MAKTTIKSNNNTIFNTDASKAITTTARTTTTTSATTTSATTASATTTCGNRNEKEF